jgi:hypothetical protein
MVTRRFLSASASSPEERVHEVAAEQRREVLGAAAGRRNDRAPRPRELVDERTVALVVFTNTICFDGRRLNCAAKSAAAMSGPGRLNLAVLPS